MRKTILLIFCGLPFAGKTTLANELVKRFGFVRIDLDEINGERGLGGLSNDEISNEDWQETYQISYERTEHLLREGKTVINDTANFTREQRDKLRAIARKVGVDSIVIYVNVPESVARQRWQNNRLTKLRYDLRDEDFAEVADNFQHPTEDENILQYDQTTSVNEWIKQNLAMYENSDLHK